MNGCRRFILSGLKQAGGVAAIFLSIGVVGWLLGRFGWFGGVTQSFGGLLFLFAVSLLSGPVPALLACLDISTKALCAASVALILPYWSCLGVALGFTCWKLFPADPDQEQSVPPRRTLKYMRWLIEITAFVLAVVSFPLGFVAGPSHISRGHSVQNTIINNLRQIDAAKLQFAFEKHLPEDYVPTEAELAPYLGRLGHEGIRRVGPERYVLNPICEPPCAVLDSDWRIRRQGWREGYTIPKQEFRLCTPLAPAKPPP
jgi:hypothetical protein